MSWKRYPHGDLVELARRLFESSGLGRDRAETVAELLVEADLLGFRTHGLNRVASNLRWLASGETRAHGEPEVLVDRGAVIHWDARRLPGPWVMARALDLCCERAVSHGQVTMSIRRAQHVACLAAYLLRAVERGLVVQILCSSPADRCVSAFGGSEPLFSPNPFAFGAPTSDGPILIDMSLSIVAEGHVARAQREGVRMESACLKDHRGEVSDDPGDYWSEPRGSIMPLGGLDHGYKGYGLCLWSELLCQALANYGRSDELEPSEENSVNIQVFDPEAFGSRAGFLREADYLSRMCRESRVRAGDAPVRVPGDRAVALRSAQLRDGVLVSDAVVEDLRPWAAASGVPLPPPLPATD